VTRIEVHVDRLLLDGFDHAQARSIAAAIEQAMIERLGSVDAARVKPRALIGPLDVVAPAQPLRIGNEVANAIVFGAGARGANAASGAGGVSAGGAR